MIAATLDLDQVDEDWTPTPSDVAAIEAGCYFDDAAADRVCRFFETRLRHSRGQFAGKPFLLEPWERQFLRDLYGWKRADGTRRFREAYCEIPKKNGKSALLSGLCLYALVEEEGAEVYTGAVDRAQAGIIFRECARMVEASPALAASLVVVESKNLILYPARNGRLVAMSADAPSKDGVSASCTVLDEVHRFKTSALYDVMKYAGAARLQPLLIVITTAGHDRHSLCWQLHERALGVIKGDLIDPDLLAVVYAADDLDDLDDPATWRKANPSMGSIIKEEDFAREHREAKLLPRLWNLFRRLRLNIWTESATRWLPLDRWDAGCRPLDLEQLEGRPCYAALDVSSVTDLTSLVLVIPMDDDDGRPYLRVVPYFWMPSETAERRAAADKVPYPQWVRAGHMIPTEGSTTDYGAIRQLVNEVAERFQLVKLGMDPWSTQQLANQLTDDGVEVVKFPQTYAHMSPASKEVERLILSGQIEHDGNPCLRWCVGNATVITDANGNIKPDKKRSAERIDGLVAMVMAVGLAVSDVPELQPEIHVVEFD